LAGFRSSEAQPPERSARIGLLAPASRSEDVEGFLAGMRDLGYIEGRNLVLEYRAAGGKIERLDDLLAELIRLKVDVIVTGGTPAVSAARSIGRTGSRAPSRRWRPSRPRPSSSRPARSTWHTGAGS